MIATDLRATTRRIYRAMAILAAAGLVASSVAGGWRAALGFAVGSGFSAVSFAIFHLVVHHVGGGLTKRSSQLAIAFAGLRYIGLGAIAYAILTFFKGSIPAALVGCFLACAAVLIEAVLELAGNRLAS